jgi:hypothetical protein
MVVMDLLTAAEAARLIDNRPEIVRRHVIPSAYYLSMGEKEAKKPLYTRSSVFKFRDSVDEHLSAAPVYMTLTAAAEAADADPSTIHRNIEPAHWYSRAGKRYQLYEQADVIAWANDELELDIAEDLVDPGKKWA